MATPPHRDKVLTVPFISTDRLSGRTSNVQHRGPTMRSRAPGRRWRKSLVEYRQSSVFHCFNESCSTQQEDEDVGERSSGRTNQQVSIGLVQSAPGIWERSGNDLHVLNLHNTHRPLQWVNRDNRGLFCFLESPLTPFFPPFLQSDTLPVDYQCV